MGSGRHSWRKSSGQPTVMAVDKQSRWRPADPVNPFPPQGIDVQNSGIQFQMFKRFI
jgi:hypothetical protein